MARSRRERWSDTGLGTGRFYQAQTLNGTRLERGVNKVSSQIGASRMNDNSW